MNVTETAKSSADDLEPYRQLVELQREIARLALQNERASQKCEKLRNSVADKVLKKSSARQSEREKAEDLLAKMPLSLVRTTLLSLINNEKTT